MAFYPEAYGSLITQVFSCLPGQAGGDFSQVLFTQDDVSVRAASVKQCHHLEVPACWEE